jgi:hypothetical protein
MLKKAQTDEQNILQLRHLFNLTHQCRLAVPFTWQQVTALEVLRLNNQ